MTNQLATNNRLVPRRDDVFAPFESFFNDVFDEMWGNFSGLKSNSKKGFPILDVIQDGNKWIIEAAVPGVKSEDLKVEIEPGKDSRILKISGKMEYSYSDKLQYYKKELRRSSFERSLYLPEFVTGEPEATLKNGILRLIWEVQQLNTPEKKNIPIRCIDTT